jgi:hypothetical protein
MRRRSRPAAAPVLAILALGTLTGCGSAGSGGGGAGGSGPPPAQQCGTTHTPAGVPVEIDVQQGHVACHLAMTVERGYERAVASGKMPGNGGGAPVHIGGWVCQGFNTPVVLSTGHASACRKGKQQILAVLPPPSSPTPSSH